MLRDLTAQAAGSCGHLREITSGDIDTVLEPLRGHRRYNAVTAVHAAHPKAIRELTLDDIDLPNRRITLAGHRQPLGDLTHNALVAWPGYRRATWPKTANRHVEVSRISALGSKPVSADFLDKHQLRGISLERIRRDRILHEALTTGADPLHLSLVFYIDHTNAMA